MIDDFSRYSWLFPLHYKSEVKTVLTQFKTYVQTQFDSPVKTVRSDNGGAFVNNYLTQLFLLYGVVHQMSCPHTPEQKRSGREKAQTSHRNNSNFTHSC